MPTTRRPPGRSSPPATSCSIAASTRRVKQQGADFAFDGGTADITGSLQGLLVDRLGPALHEADRQRGAPFRDLIKAPTSRSPTSRTRRRTRRPSTRRGPASRPTRGSSTASPTPASTTSRWPTTTSRTPAASGLLQTIKNVTKRGIAVSGAGKDLAAARKPAILEAGGIKVAILGYDAIAGGYHATALQGRQRGAVGDERQGGRCRRAQGRCGPRHRLPALGHRIRPDARSPTRRRWRT